MILGELALRTIDLPRMVSFYRDVVGLEVFSDNSPELVFLKVADLAEGHPQILGIFDRGVGVGPERSTLDHFAFVVDLAELGAHRTRVESHGVAVVDKTFPYFHWRSFFFADPDGNTVEFVAYDESV